jgi:hypothetical protein
MSFGYGILIARHSIIFITFNREVVVRGLRVQRLNGKGEKNN